MPPLLLLTKRALRRRKTYTTVHGGCQLRHYQRGNGGTMADARLWDGVRHRNRHAGSLNYDIAAAANTKLRESALEISFNMSVVGSTR